MASRGLGVLTPRAPSPSFARYSPTPHPRSRLRWDPGRGESPRDAHASSTTQPLHGVQLLGVPAEAIRTDVPHRPELWGDIRRWYRLSAQWADTQAKSLAGLGAEVVVRRGELVVRVLGPIPALFRGFILHADDPDDPYVFRIDLT